MADRIVLILRWGWCRLLLKYAHLLWSIYICAYLYVGVFFSRTKGDGMSVCPCFSNQSPPRWNKLEHISTKIERLSELCGWIRESHVRTSTMDPQAGLPSGLMIVWKLLLLLSLLHFMLIAAVGFPLFFHPSANFKAFFSPLQNPNMRRLLELMMSE